VRTRGRFSCPAFSGTGETSPCPRRNVPVSSAACAAAGTMTGTDRQPAKAFYDECLATGLIIIMGVRCACWY